MTLSLLQAGNHLSLEFEPSELETVRSYICARYPDMLSERAGIVTVVRFGGEKFTFQSEWDDPCLISGSNGGDELLREIYRLLT